MAGQQAFVFKTWGGKRKGAGRPSKGFRSSERHQARVRFIRTSAAHVTLRVVASIPTLRRPDAYHAIRRAMYTVVGRDEFRIVHIGLERDHLHLIVEADSHVALAKGMHAFQTSAAQRLHRAISAATGQPCAGKVFADRYHVRLITTPTQARHSISYVLNNWRKHRYDQGMETMFWDVDYYSSGPTFPGWAELESSPVLLQTPDSPCLSVSLPRTWLLRTGWRRAGSISLRDVPGPGPSPSSSSPSPTNQTLPKRSIRS